MQFLKNHVYRAEIVWRRNGDFASNSYSRGHQWLFDGGIAVPASASPAIVPVPQSVESAVDPEEAFVASLSSCHMLWFLDLSRQNGIVVEDYRDKAEAVMDRIGPGKFAIVTVKLKPEVTVSGDGAVDGIFARLHREAHEKCFIANSVNCEVCCEPLPVIFEKSRG